MTNCKILNWDRPLIMGILNVTPDSFSDAGKYFDSDLAIEHAQKMISEGADIIDVGGESTRPGAPEVAVEEELRRVLPVIEALSAEIETPISIDTRKAEVARAACKAGSSIINDISGLSHDPEIAAVAAENEAYLILMHMRGTPQTMQEHTDYEDLMGEIAQSLNDSAREAIKAGVDKNKIIIDPGIGFAKTVRHNFSILYNLHRLTALGFPIMVGVSRKSFIGKTLDLPVDDRLEGSLAAAVYAVISGASIVRVHDVLPTARALKIIEMIRSSGQ